MSHRAGLPLLPSGTKMSFLLLPLKPCPLATPWMLRLKCGPLGAPLLAVAWCKTRLPTATPPTAPAATTSSNRILVARRFMVLSSLCSGRDHLPHLQTRYEGLLLLLWLHRKVA